MEKNMKLSEQIPRNFQSLPIDIDLIELFVELLLRHLQFLRSFLYDHDDLVYVLDPYVQNQVVCMICYSTCDKIIIPVFMKTWVPSTSNLSHTIFASWKGSVEVNKHTNHWMQITVPSSPTYLNFFMIFGFRIPRTSKNIC